MVVVLACLFVVIAGLAIGRGARSLESIPRVVDSAQITKDGMPKSRANLKLAIDGGRLYFQEGSINPTEQNTALVQVATQGGDTARVPVSLHIPLAYEFSPVRSELLFSAGEFDHDKNERPLWALPLPAGPPHRVGDVLATDAAWAPDGRHIAFANAKSIFIADPDGSHVRKLVTVTGYCFWIRYSPDGKRLRFTVSGDSNGQESLEIMELAADGTGLHTLPVHGGCCGMWSSDGNYFFYSKGRDVWVLPERHSWFGTIDLGEAVQITAGPLAYDAPTPGPGKEELFVIGHQDRVELVHRFNGQKGWEPFLGGISAEEMQVSPDGQWAVYTTFPDFNLWRSKLDGSERLQLTFAPINAHEPHWSPDGKQILFSDYPNRLFVVSAGGGAPRQVLPGDHPDPDWSGAADWLPDGKSIIFGRHLGCSDATCWAIYRLDLETQQSVKIEGSDQMLATRVSRDGHYIVALLPGGSPVQSTVMLYDLHTQKWTALAQAHGSMTWSHDSKAIYMTIKHDNAPTEMVRISVPSGHIQRLFDLKGVTLGGFWPDRISLLPDDSLVLTFDRSNEEIYRLNLRYYQE